MMRGRGRGGDEVKKWRRYREGEEEEVVAMKQDVEVNMKTSKKGREVGQKKEKENSNVQEKNNWRLIPSCKIGQKTTKKQQHRKENNNDERGDRRADGE